MSTFKDPQAGPTTSIDTLHLLCDVKLRAEFQLYAGNFKITNDEDEDDVNCSVLWWEDNEPIWGKDARAFAQGFIFKLARINPCGPLQLSISFSFPRWRWGHNAAPMTHADVEELINSINECAEGLGLFIDAAAAKITEIHLFRDVVLHHRYDDYLPILRAVEPPYCS